MLRGLSFGTNTNSLSKQKTSKSFLLFKRRISPKTNVNLFFFLRWAEETLGKTERRCSFVFGMYNLYGAGGRGRGVGGVFGLIEVCDGLAQQQGPLCQPQFTTGGDGSLTRT